MGKIIDDFFGGNGFPSSLNEEEIEEIISSNKKKGKKIETENQKKSSLQDQGKDQLSGYIGLLRDKKLPGHFA